jgi:hypothetical protein
MCREAKNQSGIAVKKKPTNLEIAKPLSNHFLKKPPPIASPIKLKPKKIKYQITV